MLIRYLSAFLSQINLKLHNIPATPMLAKKVKAKLDSTHRQLVLIEFPLLVKEIIQSIFYIDINTHIDRT